MLKNKSKLLLIILIVITVALSTLSFANEEDVNENSSETTIEPRSQESIVDVVMEETEGSNNIAANIKNDDQYIIGDSVVIEDIINGNLYVLANKVTINSQIVGNVFVCANTFTVSEQGYISNTIYVVANDIEIRGITYDVYAVADNVTISGYIYRDSHISADNFCFYGTSGRNLSVVADKLSFERTEGADSATQGKIMGDLNYSSNEEQKIPENIVEGKINFNQVQNISVTPNYFLSTIYFIVLVVAIWAILKWISPKFLEKSDNLLSDKPLKTIGFGILGLVLIPIVSVLLILANITASVGLLLMAIYLILICISKAIFVISLNNILAKKLKFETTLKTFLLLLVVSIISKVLTIIPFAGIVFSLIYIIVGMGIIVRNLVSRKDK